MRAASGTPQVCSREHMTAKVKSPLACAAREALERPWHLHIVQIMRRDSANSRGGARTARDDSDAHNFEHYVNPQGAQRWRGRGAAPSTGRRRVRRFLPHVGAGLVNKQCRAARAVWRDACVGKRHDTRDVRSRRPYCSASGERLARSTSAQSSPSSSASACNAASNAFRSCNFAGCVAAWICCNFSIDTCV